MNDTQDKATILIVDDDPDVLEQTRLHLEIAGYQVISAESEKEAEERLVSFQPDLAILDLMMENQDSGFILAYKIKKVNPNTPIILVTAVTSQTGIAFDMNSREEASWIKADAILVKDIRYEQLLSEVERLLKNRKLAQVP